MAWDENELRTTIAGMFDEATDREHDVTLAYEAAGAKYRAYHAEYKRTMRESVVLMTAERKRQRESVATIRARRKKEGKCTFCETKQDVESKALCTKHLHEAAQRYRDRRKIMRERLPDLRPGVTHHFAILSKCNKAKCVAGKIDGSRTCTRCGGEGVRETDGYLTCNTYEDGRLGEIFVRIGKSGAEEAIYEQWAIAVSVALQFGVPVEAYFRKFLATQFEPAGATKNKEIPRCSSVLDYIAKYVLSKFVKKEEVTP